MNKNLFSKIIDTSLIDREFLTLWKAKADNLIIRNYIRNNYFILAYSYAATILNNKVSRDKLEDEVSELVLDTMSGIIEAAGKGALNFKGKAAFSTYIFAALKYGKNDKKKIYYPSEVKRKGLPAMEIYRLLLIEKYSYMEILSSIKQSFQLSEEKIIEYINLASSYTEKEDKRISTRKQNVVDSYDRLLEETPQYEKGASLSAQSDYFKKYDCDLLNDALTTLTSTEKDIVEGHLLDNRWENIKEMQKELNLKNGVYEIKKVKEKIKRVIGDDFILE